MAEVQKPIPFKFRLKAKLFRIPVVGDWLYNWNDQQDLKKLNQKYLPLIQAAKQAKHLDRALELEHNLYDDSRDIEDAAAGRNSEKLLATARKWGVIPPIKNQDSNDWYHSTYTGNWILAPVAEQRLRREITEEQRGARDEVRKNTTLVIATLSFLLSFGLLLINIFTLRNNRHAIEITEKNATNQLQLTRTQLELQQRPWIKITNVQTRGNGPIIPAMSFQNGMGGNDQRFQQVTFQLKISVKNIGHSVAELAVRSDLFLPSWDKFSDAVAQEQKRFCDSEAGKPQGDYYPSFIVFPDETFDWYAAAGQFVDESRMNTFPQTGESKWIIPVVIVCANYRLKSLPNVYQTSSVYEVFRKDNRTRFFQPGVGMPADKMFLERNGLRDYAY